MSYWNGRRVIVTGGAGFIGSALVKRLTAEGAVVSVLDNLWRGSLENLLSDQGHCIVDVDTMFHRIDLTNAADCIKHMRNAEIVYHLADVVAGIDYVFGNEAFVFRQNLLINTNCLNACLINGVPNYVYVGTACSYPKSIQMQNRIVALEEDKVYPAEPESSYGWSKLMGEYEAELAMKAKNINVGLLRLHNVYGPGASFEPGRSQALPSLIRKAVRYPGEPFIVWGSGAQYRDFVYVDDVIEALLLAATKGMNEGAIQIGSEHAISLREAAEKIVQISRKPIVIRFDDTKPEGDRGRIAVCDRARKILGWQPKVPFESGLARNYRWIEARITAKEAIKDSGHLQSV
jgi:nucleoside-diphosphate-sugar epimerase